MQLLCSLICSLISDKSEMRWCSLYVCMYVDGGRTMALCSAFYLLLDISVINMLDHITDQVLVGHRTVRQCHACVIIISASNKPCVIERQNKGFQLTLGLWKKLRGVGGKVEGGSGAHCRPVVSLSIDTSSHHDSVYPNNEIMFGYNEIIRVNYS